MRSLPFCTTQLKCQCLQLKTYDYLGALWEIMRVNVATLFSGQGMDDHPDSVSTCTPLKNQLCYAT